MEKVLKVFIKLVFYALQQSVGVLAVFVSLLIPFVPRLQ